MVLDDEKLMERYLLGVLPEEEAARLEERSLADYDFFESMLVVENRLIDDYVTRQLPARERAQFERHFLASPKRRERVEFARAFLKTVSAAPAAEPAVVTERRIAEERTSWPERIRSFFGLGNLSLGLAASALLLIGFAGWSLLETRRVREELAQLNRERAAREQREQGLQARLDSQQGQNEELRSEIARNRAELERLREIEARLQQTQPQSPLSSLASIILTPAGFRGGPSGSTPQLTIGPDAKSARFTLQVDQELIKLILENYPNVRAELVKDGQVQSRRRGLKPTAGKAFVITLPAEQFTSGDYQIRLFGSGAAGETGIGDYQFKVEKK